MRIPFVVGALGAIALAAALGACGPPPTNSPNASVPPLTFLQPSGEPIDTVTVALFEDVDPSHAPAWHNDAERLVFHQLYVPITSGLGLSRTRPLVERPVAKGKSTTFKLRDDARFWDGTRVTAQQVAECVRVGIDTSVGIDSIVVLDDQRLQVSATWPVKLQSSSRAVVRRTPDGLWPMGTGAYQVDLNETLRDGEIIMTPAFDVSGPVIRFVDARGVDPRDLLDHFVQPRVDLMVLRDRAVIEYAASLGRFIDVRLLWNRAYMLIAVDRVEAIERGDSVPALASEFRSALEGGPVRFSYAGGWPTAAWEGAAGRCASATPPRAAASLRSRRIVYNSDDPTARDLADRIASLAATDSMLASAVPGIVGTGSSLVSIGLPPDQFANSLYRGSDFAYVMGIYYDWADFCPALNRLLAAAPWVAGRRLSDKILPLVKTESIALVERPTAGFGFDIRTDDFGNLTITGVGSAEQP